MTTRFLRPLALALLAAPAAAQTVHVVDSGFDGQVLGNAVTNAADGDVILVKSAYNGGFTVSGKSLTIVADSGVAAQVQGIVTIQNVPAGGRVVVRGFHVEILIGNGALVTLKDNAGSVWIEESLIRVRRFYGSPVDSMSATNCASVVMRACQLDCDGTALPTEGAGLRVESSSVTLFDCALVGGLGMGSSTGGFPGHPGGPGVHLGSGSLFASGSAFFGGWGGVAPVFPPAMGGAGGDAIVAGGTTTIRDGLLVPGQAGGGTAGSNPSGQPYAILPGGAVAQPPGAARHFSISTPVRELQDATYTVGGVAGENVGVLFSLAPQGTPFPLLDGVLALDLTAGDAFLLGTVPPAGSLVAPLPMPGLPASLQGVTFFEQSFFFDLPLTYLVLGPASSLLILDDSL